MSNDTLVVESQQGLSVYILLDFSVQYSFLQGMEYGARPLMTLSILDKVGQIISEQPAAPRQGWGGGDLSFCNLT